MSIPLSWKRFFLHASFLWLRVLSDDFNLFKAAGWLPKGDVGLTKAASASGQTVAMPRDVNGRCGSCLPPMLSGHLARPARQSKFWANELHLSKLSQRLGPCVCTMPLCQQHRSWNIIVMIRVFIDCLCTKLKQLVKFLPTETFIKSIHLSKLSQHPPQLKHIYISVMTECMLF